MSELVLVRHGQASFFSDDYDRLSEIGELQARRLAEYWLARDVNFDEVYSGPLLRQRRTAEILGEMYQQAAKPWPALQILEQFAEYDGEGIVRELLPILSERDESARRLADEYNQAREPEAKYKTYHRMLSAAATAWLEGTVAAPGVETWRIFHQRVSDGLRHITEMAGSGRRIALITSGGPVSIAVQLAMQAPEGLALELNWRLRNCSLTEIVFSRGRFTLDSFNGLPHLHDRALWTYR